MNLSTYISINLYFFLQLVEKLCRVGESYLDYAFPQSNELNEIYKSKLHTKLKKGSISTIEIEPSKCLV